MDQKTVTIEEAQRGTPCVWRMDLKEFVLSEDAIIYIPGIIPASCGDVQIDKLYPMGYNLATQKLVMITSQDEIAAAKTYFANYGSPPIMSGDSDDDSS